MKKVKIWIEAMRLRTLPVSIAGVLCAFAFALMSSDIRWLPGVLCLLFAVLAQIASNFANEYYDYKSGLDKAGRVGPRRGVTEGDITPGAMKNATFGVLGAACIIGCSLIYWGGWWLIAVGLLIAIGVLAYSTGPYPLSRHGLGEIAVIFFFGIIPVNMTYYLMCGAWSTSVVLASLAIGLLGANVLIVNNYRDMDDDREVGKRTLCVIFGRKFVSILYLINGISAILLTTKTWLEVDIIYMPIASVILLFSMWKNLRRKSGSQLNPLLGETAMFMFAYTLALFAIVLIKRY